MSNEIAKVKDESLLSQANFEHSWRMAVMISKTSLVPKMYYDKPQDVLVAMELGRSLKLSPLQAVQNIAVINGKPSVYGDALLAICSGHPAFVDIIEDKILDSHNKVVGYKCTVIRKNRTNAVRIFTIENAQKAGLWGKAGTWTNYPERMLQMRARTFALRDSFADALGGVSTVEESEDHVMKDITPKRESLESQVLTALEKKPELPKQEQAPIPDEIKESKRPVSFDELVDIRDFIAEHKVSKTKVTECLAKFEVSHLEHLASELTELFKNELISE